MNETIPAICDYHCPFADFPPAETAGICRTMSAVYCKKLSELVNKNAPCEWRLRQAGSKKTAASKAKVGAKKKTGAGPGAARRKKRPSSR